MISTGKTGAEEEDHHIRGDARENILYESRDEAGIWLQFFREGGAVFLVGPYVKQVFDVVGTQRVFAALRIPAAYVTSFRLYYSAFPLLSSSQVRDTITVCVRALSGAVREFGACRIEAGDTEHVLIAYDKLSGQSSPHARYANAVYQDSAIAMSMVRALARKAAERGGASVIKINEITQRAVQRLLSAKSMEDKLRANNEMIYELTDAVRRHRLDLGGYPAMIRKVLEHIQFNYSQKLSLDMLAQLANCSPSYLAKEFKRISGTTVFAYIAHLRCTNAAQMLRDTDATVQTISSFVGYSDNNYFVKVFRMQFGVTPTSYRAQERLKKGAALAEQII